MTPVVRLDTPAVGLGRDPMRRELVSYMPLAFLVSKKIGLDTAAPDISAASEAAVITALVIRR